MAQDRQRRLSLEILDQNTLPDNSQISVLLVVSSRGKGASEYFVSEVQADDPWSMHLLRQSRLGPSTLQAHAALCVI